MQALFVTCGLGLLAFAVVQVAFVIAYTAKNRCTRRIRLTDDQLPKVAVIVGLRGADPFLLESLKRLLTLDYPRYEVCIVVDGRDDPAWGVVERAIHETGAEHVHYEEYLDDPKNGLVNSTNSKIVQAVRGLDQSVEVIAMMDGDAMPHADWLRDLVHPLVLDDSVGATYGNRWFIPALGQWGSICRYLWNLAAVPPMDLMQIPWGGCYAIRAEAVRSGGMVDEWARQIALDAASKNALKKQGLSLKFVPQLIMLNAEECSLPFCVNFIRRQLKWTFLYHPQGSLAIAKPMVVAALFFGTLLSGIGAGCGGDADVARWALSGIAIYWLSSAGCAFTLEYVIRRAVRRRGERVQWLSARKSLKIVLAIPVTIVLELIAAVQAACSRRVHWRGMILEIAGPHEIRVIHKGRAADMRSADIPTSI